MKLKAAIIESGSSHEECMDSWLLFLQPEYECDIIASDKVMQRIGHLQANQKIIFTGLISLFQIKSFASFSVFSF